MTHRSTLRASYHRRSPSSSSPIQHGRLQLQSVAASARIEKFATLPLAETQKGKDIDYTVEKALKDQFVTITDVHKKSKKVKNKKVISAYKAVSISTSTAGPTLSLSNSLISRLSGTISTSTAMKS